MKLDSLIFDVDGVLIDTSKSYDVGIQETMIRFGATPVQPEMIYERRRQGGYNDDWLMTQHLLHEQGIIASYGEVMEQFVDLYVGFEGNGLFQHELWLLSHDELRQLSQRFPIALFTGRRRWELDMALKQYQAEPYFSFTITVDEVSEGKPSPEGLIKAMSQINGRAPLYFGDNVDDARAAKAASVPFVGIIPPNHPNPSAIQATLIAEGAIEVLPATNHLFDLVDRVFGIRI